ncbi:hypothetical protein K438DRAFT_1963943 [Mycena galopus ATCC 62051]|nr:hypothetical protein K438DRAFT_1963943 [Mycena galopus ATCC 62051]
MPRASSSSPKKAGTSASPRKAKPAAPGIKKRREEWNETLPALWVKQTTFKHPANTRTITKTDAKKRFKLNDREIGTLPYEQQLSAAGYMMQLYSQSQVTDLARRKCAKLGVELDLFSAKNELPAWREPMLNPQPPPSEIAEYTCPPDPVEPDPEVITWDPSKLSGPVSIADACRLYCIEPTDIQDLSAHSSWIDLATVARRAVTLHGGFYAHEKLLRERRRAEENELDKADYDKRETLNFRFSPMIQAQWKRYHEDDWGYDYLPPPPNRVAVLYPIKSVETGDFECEWMPCTYQFNLTTMFFMTILFKIGEISKPRRKP